MLKHIAADCYDEVRYEESVAFYNKEYDSVSEVIHKKADRVVVGTLMTFFSDDFDRGTMEKFIMLVSGMLWAMDHGGIDDDDPEDLAYNVWDVLKDFSTGDYDDLFTPEDLVLVKRDIKRIYDYFDEHPSLKGD